MFALPSSVCTSTTPCLRCLPLCAHPLGHCRRRHQRPSAPSRLHGRTQSSVHASMNGELREVLDRQGAHFFYFAAVSSKFSTRSGTSSSSSSSSSPSPS